jgi:hypothetical protein
MKMEYELLGQSSNVSRCLDDPLPSIIMLIQLGAVFLEQ